MIKQFLLFSFILLIFNAYTQQTLTASSVRKVTHKTSSSCTQQSKFEDDYYRRYDHYKDIYEIRNEVVFHLDIFIWQKDDGTGNYLNTIENRSELEQSIAYLDYFYANNVEPSFKPIPGVKDYSSTKIRFVLNEIYFEQDSECWAKGKTANYNDAIFLNNKANTLYPENKNILKIHFTGANSRHSGYASFPVANMNREHFIVSFNKKQKTELGESAWPLAIHLAHEFGHNLDLFHTYDGGHNRCDESDPDYLDDVFGASYNNSKVCFQDAGWGCDYESRDNTCTNNIMGGNKGARYFSPK